MQRHPRRVLLTTDTVTGIWEYSLELARGLSEHNIEVHLAASGGLPTDKQRHDAQVIPGLTFYPAMLWLEWMDRPWQDVELNVRRVEDITWTTNPDLIHANEYALPALGRFRAPVLVMAHGDRLTRMRTLAAADEDEPSLGEYEERVRAGLQAATRVTAPTGWLLDRMKEAYGDFRAADPIPHGRDATLFEPAAERDPFVLAAGRLWDAGKNFHGLDAAANGLPWPVKVAGARVHPGGVRAGEFEHLERLGVLSQPELRDLMNRAAVFVHPARYEPFGLPPFEAALAGCALVLADIPPLRELWPEDAARWVTPDDPAALRTALDDLIADAPTRTALAARGREHALTRTREVMVERTLALYREVMAAG